MQLRDRVKEFRRVRASELRAHPKNWRLHPDRQRSAVEGMLNQLGFAGVVLAHETAGGELEIIDGHLRAEICGDKIVPVVVLDVNETEAKALLATYDALGSMAETEPDMLSDLLKEVGAEFDGLDSIVQGVLDDATIDRLFQGEPDPDEVPEPPATATTESGDIWLLGRHRLMCGDSSKVKDLDRLLDGANIHLVNTDPPYNVKVEPRSNNAIAAGLSSFGGTKHHQSLDLARKPSKAKGTTKKLRPKDRPLANDFVTDDEFDKLLLAWFGNIARVLEPGRTFYIWGGYANCANYPPVLRACALYFSQAVIWVKEHPVLTRKDFMGNHEWCFYGWREGGPHVFFGPNNAPDVWSVKKVTHSKMVHLTEKPVELASLAIGYSSRPGENVLDLFGGSGSTLIAAEQLGRNAFLMELDALYCDVIVERYENFTGQKAKRIGA